MCLLCLSFRSPFGPKAGNILRIFLCHAAINTVGHCFLFAVAQKRNFFSFPSGNSMKFVSVLVFFLLYLDYIDYFFFISFWKCYEVCFCVGNFFCYTFIYLMKLWERL